MAPRRYIANWDDMHMAQKVEALGDLVAHMADVDHIDEHIAVHNADYAKIEDANAKAVADGAKAVAAAKGK